MKKKVNFYKIGALILMLIEIGIALWVDKDAMKTDITLWRLYVACVMFIPINVIFICIKQRKKVK